MGSVWAQGELSGNTALQRGDSLLQTGNMEAALPYLERAVAQYRDAGVDSSLVESASARAFAQYLSGDLYAAQRCLTEFLSVFDSIA